MEKNMKNNMQGASLAVQWGKTLPPSEGDAGWIPGWGATNPHAKNPEHKQEKQYYNKFSKDLIFKKYITELLCCTAEIKHCINI